MFVYNVGDVPQLGGFFTAWSGVHIPILGGSNDDLEDYLGFERGRLGRGFTVLFLQEMPEVGSVALAGTTLQSGGRVGLPSATEAADRKRIRVFDELRDRKHAEWDARSHLGPNIVEKGKAWSDFDALCNALEKIELKGVHRATKIVPATGHDPSKSPEEQYPPGKGVNQLVLTKPVSWKAAINIHGNGDWELPTGWPPVDREFLMHEPTGHTKSRIGTALEEMM